MIFEWWLLGTYLAGTFAGCVIGNSVGKLTGIQLTIDKLIAAGYLRSITRADGEVDLLKYHDTDTK